MSGIALAVSASTRAFSVAVRTATGAITTAAPDGNSATDLAAVVADLFDREGLTPDQLDELRLDVGPGSYTGLRVAVTFARVAASFRNIPVLTTTSLELMALAAFRSERIQPDSTVRPVLDARRNRFHHAPIRTRTTMELTALPRASELHELADAIESGEILLAEARLHETLAPIATPRDALLAEPEDFDASLLFDSGLALQMTPHDELEPLYLMGSYAE